MSGTSSPMGRYSRSRSSTTSRWVCQSTFPSSLSMLAASTGPPDISAKSFSSRSSGRISRKRESAVEFSGTEGDDGVIRAPERSGIAPQKDNQDRGDGDFDGPLAKVVAGPQKGLGVGDAPPFCLEPGSDAQEGSGPDYGAETIDAAAQTAHLFFRR